MAPKRPRPLDDPPAASSSDEAEEEQISSAQAESEEVLDSEEKSEEDEEQEKRNHAPVQISADKLKNPQAESDSDSESDSDFSQKSARASNYTIKPIMENSFKASDGPIPEPSTAAKTAGKSASAKNEKLLSKSKKARPSNVEEDDDVGGTTVKKSAINRLWSLEDEIAILNGVIEFRNEKGYDPSSNHEQFHEFVKKSLQVDVPTNKLMDKLRRLKKKYKNNLGKSTDGNDPVLSNSHEHEAFILSKQIWGNLSDKHASANVSNHVKSNGKIPKKSDHDKPSVVSVDNATKVEDMVDVGVKEVQLNEEKQDLSELYPFLMKAFEPNQKNMSLPYELKSYLSLLGNSVLKEFDNEWKKQNMVEVKAFLRKVDLIRDQTSRLLDAMKSSKS